MGLWDMFVDNVIEPFGGLIVEGVEATGRGIDTVVTNGIEVIGGGIDKAVEVVKENPLKTAAVIGTVLTAGTGGLIGAAAIAASAKGATTSMNGKVKPVMGCVLHCDLALVAEHSGIYVGNGKIAHLDGSGKIEIVTARQFLRRLGGLNPASSIYVSCNKGDAKGSSSAAHLARAMAGGKRSYNLILDNCHQFASGCITGNFDNSDNFLWMLKHTAEQEMNVTDWRLWDLSS